MPTKGQLVSTKDQLVPTMDQLVHPAVIGSPHTCKLAVSATHFIIKNTSESMIGPLLASGEEKRYGY